MPFIITLIFQQWIVRTVRDEIHIFDKANWLLTHHAVDLSEYVCVCVCVCIDFLSFLLLSLPSFFYFSFFFFNMGPGTSSFVTKKKKKKEPKKQKTKKKTHIKTESSRMHQNNRFLDFCVYFYKKKKKTVFLRYCHIFLFE